ncbi:MAG: hypothetical protein Q9172_001849 [Xanthocarpia lactea]
MNPSSAYLQDLLRERKASQRAGRINEQNNTNNERQVQSSPIGPSAASKPQSRRISGSMVPKEMGLREMEEYLSKLNKQNFDLKLEIFHRRQRTDALEVKAARLDELETQNNEFRQLNDDLLQELEKRDIAVGEAVSLICELEAKVERLEKEQQRSVRPVTPIKNHDAVPKALEKYPVDAPVSMTGSPSNVRSSGRSFATRDDCNRLPDDDLQHEEDRLLRNPSFLSDTKPSTSALRSLFHGHANGSTANSLGLQNPSMLSLRRVGSPFSQDDFPETLDGDTFSLNPRRLSLLSESSFVSVYGQNKEKITPSSASKHSLNASPPRNGDASAKRLSPQEGRIRQWIENRDHPASPSERSAKHAKSNTFSSIGEMLKSDRANPRDALHSASPTRSGGRHQPQQRQRYEKPDTKPSFAGTIFGPDALPPTPGTMSSATLGGRSSNHSIIAEKSLNDGMSRPTSGHMSDIPHGRSHGSNAGLRSLQDVFPHTGLPSAFDHDTDIEISDDDGHAAYPVASKQQSVQLDDKSWATPLIGGPVKASRTLGSNNTQRPRLNKYTTSTMNEDDMETNRPSRTISYPSPGRLQQATIENTSEATEEAVAGTNCERELSTQQGSTMKPSLPRSFSTHSRLSQSTVSGPAQTFASRLFRRNPSSTLPAPKEAETRSAESKLRLPRPTSLYARTASNPPPSLAAPLDVPRHSRSGTSGGPTATASNPRRHSGGFALDAGKELSILADDGMGTGEQQQLPPQQSKRLSVGAIGRSASLRIKEGFGRKK